jgi:glucosamine-6-phosphate deaminase
VEVVIVADAAEIGSVVADAVQALLTRNPCAVLGLATGSSPLPVYDELVRRCADGRISFSRATAFLLDENVGLPAGHPESYRSDIDRPFTGRVDFAARSVRGPDGAAADVVAACRAYEDAITAAGGVDLQLLGLGRDGHIAFNEPGSSLGSRTRLKTLTSQTVSDNGRFFGPGDDVPRHVVTQGVGTILDARHLVLVAAGAGKAEPLARVVEGPVTAMVPGSALQLHPHVSVVADAPAAARLTLADYYRATWAGKPAWQAL